MLKIDYINFDDEQVTDVIKGKTIEEFEELAAWNAKTHYNAYNGIDQCRKSIAQNLLNNEGKKVLKILAIR